MFKYNSVIERAIKAAKNEAVSHKSKLVTDEMLFFALYKEVQYHLAGKVLSSNKFNLFTFRYYLDNKSTVISDPCFDEDCFIEFSPQTLETLLAADKYRELTDYEQIEGVHLAIALLESDNSLINQYIRDYEIPIKALKQDLIELMMTGEIKAFNKNYKVEDKKSATKLPKIIEEH
jgi:ATP-dependent Clp protease ATP-binding subunit ClpA